MIDWGILIPLFPLFGLSLIILGSLSLSMALTQAGFIFLGLILFFLVSFYPYGQYKFFGRTLAAIAMVLLILPFIFGVATRGAVRWIPIGGYSLQPSELVKPLLILIFSLFLSQRKSAINWRRLLLYCLYLLIPFALIFKQPDLGTSLVIVAIWLGLLLNSRVNKMSLFVLMVVLVLTGGIAANWLQPYQRQRLTSFVNPYADPAGAGYQVIQSLIAVGGGGLLGQGLGKGTQSQLQFLPERQTDFIFASISEELGLAAGLILLLSYWWLLHRLLKISRETGDEFGRLLITGVAIMIWFQLVVSVGMNLGLMPVTGITLPLVSAGGSSMLGTLVSLGLTVSVSRGQRSKSPLEIR